MENKEIGMVVSILNEIREDNTVPKNVRTKVEDAIRILNDNSEVYIKISKVMSELEEISEDVNLQPYTRTQLWDAISGLENIKP